MSEGEILPLWVIEAALDDIEDARRQAGLDRNAVVSVTDMQRPRWEQRARIVYPSFFCPSSEAWLKALAHFVLANRSFELYLEEVIEGEEDVVRGVARLFPKIDDDMMDLLRAFSVGSAERIEALSGRVDLAFERLRAAALQGLDGLDGG